jgi:hypothetical protein
MKLIRAEKALDARELFLLVGEVVEMEGLGIGYLEGDSGAEGLPVGAEAAEFVGLESDGDFWISGEEMVTAESAGPSL